MLCVHACSLCLDPRSDVTWSPGQTFIDEDAVAGAWGVVGDGGEVVADLGDGVEEDLVV